MVPRKKPAFLDRHGSALVTLLLALSTQWAAGHKTDQRIEAQGRWDAQRRGHLTMRADSLQTKLDTLAVSMGRLRARVRRLEGQRVSASGPASLAPLIYDPDEYGPQRPDPGLKAALGRLLPWKWFGGHDGR